MRNTAPAHVPVHLRRKKTTEKRKRPNGASNSFQEFFQFLWDKRATLLTTHFSLVARRHLKIYRVTLCVCFTHVYYHTLASNAPEQHRERGRSQTVTGSNGNVSTKGGGGGGGRPLLHNKNYTYKTFILNLRILDQEHDTYEGKPLRNITSKLEIIVKRTLKKKSPPPVSHL